MYKKCNRCNLSKEISFFHKNKTMADGFTNQCKLCKRKAFLDFKRRFPEKVMETRKKCYFKYRERNIRDAVEWGRNNKEKRSATRKRWSVKNPLAKAVMNKNWNAKKLGGEGTFTLEEYKNLLLKYNNKCGYCLVGDTYTADHMVPISRGGTNFIDNIVPCCLSCNSQKMDYLLKEWLMLPNCFCKNTIFML